MTGRILRKLAEKQSFYAANGSEQVNRRAIQEYLAQQKIRPAECS
jgi:hypothetical protein